MKQRFEVLDAFRGMFSFLVVFFHLANENNSFLLQNLFIRNSFLFVDFFFVLSGFVVAYNYESFINSAKTLKTFFRKRFFRLFPLHFVVLLVFLVYVGIRSLPGHSFSLTGNQWSSYTKESFFTTLFLINSIKFPDIPGLTWNTPSWSISAEIISYFVFAILMMLLHPAKRFKTVAYLAVIVLSFIGLGLLNNNYYLFTTFQNGFLRGLIGFFSGCVCYKVYYKIKGLKLSVHTATILETASLSFVVIAVCMTQYLKKFGFIYELLFVGTVLIFAFEKGNLSKAILNTGILKKMGAYSYSIYINHVIILTFFDIAFKKFTKTNQLIDSSLAIIVSFAVFFISAWTYNNIERPFMKGFKPKKIYVTGD